MYETNDLSPDHDHDGECIGYGPVIGLLMWFGVIVGMLTLVRVL